MQFSGSAHRWICSLAALGALGIARAAAAAPPDDQSTSTTAAAITAAKKQSDAAKITRSGKSKLAIQQAAGVAPVGPAPIAPAIAERPTAKPARVGAATPSRTKPALNDAGRGQVVPVAAQEGDGKAPRLMLKPGGETDSPVFDEIDQAEIEKLLTIVDSQVTDIDLYSALSLAGVQNPQLLIAQQRIVESLAMQQLAAAQILPTINLGTSYDAHTGALQQSSGNIINVNRNDLFVGAGAYAIAAGTVNIPGVMWNLNVSDTLYNYLISKQVVEQSRFTSQAVQNEVLLRVAVAYADLVRAEGRRSLAILLRNDAREVVRVTAVFAKAGQGRDADASRAQTELTRREAQVFEAHGEVMSASARLCRLLHLDPSLRLHATDNQVVPKSVVPDPIPLPELLAIAVLQRPELHAQQAAIRQTLYALDNARILPFSPTVFIGFSTGGFGGGSNLASDPAGSTPFADGSPRFGTLLTRTDTDVMAYWSLRNMGVGNKALIDGAKSRLKIANLDQLEVLNTVRAEVANAYAKTHARYATIETAEKSVRASIKAFLEDLKRTQSGEGLPIEVQDSLRLLGRSRYEYLNAILDYNTAHFELFVALGKPPADMLARPVPEDYVPPPLAKPEDKKP